VSALKIKVDPLGTPQKDFYQVRNQLVLEGHRFDSNSLPIIPYNQLFLAATGVSGPAMCNLELVQEEKRQRRNRFMTMSEIELLEMKNYLRIERMWDDIIFERIYSSFPNWDSITNRQKIWLRLNCIVNHVDNPNPRLTEVTELLENCIVDGTLPFEVGEVFISKLKSLTRLYPKFIDDSTFRDRITVMTAYFFQYLPQDEAKQVEEEEVKNYRCTSDCYRILSL
jgi:hypothetical protein